MLRSVSLFALLAVAPFTCSGQEKATPESLRQSAEKSTADWDALSKGLDQKISRLLPCNPASLSAVEEVSHASAVRLAALSAYLQAEAANAKDNTEAAKRVLSAQASIGGAWTAEHAEADQDHTAIEGRITELKESMRKRGSLNGAEQVLLEISRMAKERAVSADEKSGRKDIINSLLGNLVAAYQDRQNALATEASLLDLETARWSFYYATRISRAITECAVINPAAAQKLVRKP